MQSWAGQKVCNGVSTDPIFSAVFFPKCCVLWCFYESDVLGCWLFPFTDGGNIYSNWEPTYQLVDSWEKQQQQGAIWRPRQASGKKSKIIQTSFSFWWKGERSIIKRKSEAKAFRGVCWCGLRQPKNCLSFLWFRELWVSSFRCF